MTVATTLPANIFPHDPVVVLTRIEDGKLVAYDELLGFIRAETDAFVPDLATETGRKAIASLAFKVTRTKTAIDTARKGLTEDARKQIASINAVGNAIVEELDAIAKTVRRPLTDWERAEKDRVEKVESTFAMLRDVRPPEGLQAILAELAELERLVLDPDDFQDALPQAQAFKDAACNTMRAAHAKAVREEEDRAELQRLRAEAAERERVERAEAERLAREKAEAESKARAEEDAKRREEEAAARARAEEKRRADAEIAEANRRAAEAEASAQAERERAAAEAKRQADEQAAREKDRAHRQRVMTAAKAALMALGPDEAVAKKIVKAIVDNQIPNVSLRF